MTMSKVTSDAFEVRHSRRARHRPHRGARLEALERLPLSLVAWPQLGTPASLATCSPSLGKQRGGSVEVGESRIRSKLWSQQLLYGGGHVEVQMQVANPHWQLERSSRKHGDDQE